MSYGQSSEVKQERVYGPKLYLHDLCFTVSLKGLLPTEYWLSDVLSISFWAPETGMNVMSSFGRLCCLPLLWFCGNESGQTLRAEMWCLAACGLGHCWIGTGPSGTPRVGGRLGVWWWIVVKLCCDGQKSNYFCLKVCNIVMTGWV